MTKDRRLGRGLAALLGAPLDQPVESAVSDSLQPQQPLERLEPAAAPKAGAASSAEPVKPASPEQAGSELLRLSVYEIDNNPFQPRRDFSESEIAALAESFKEHDILQPIVVRRVGDRFQLICGERRLRAAIQLGWTTIPARVREADDRLAAELAIVENLKREDLNPIEKALSFKRYIEQHQCTQDELARRLRIDRSTIANLMRLLELPQTVADALRNGKITAGHARALLPLGDEPLQIEFCRRICDEGMSVREVERQVQQTIAAEDGEPFAIVASDAAPVKPSKSDQVAALEQELRHALGTKVEIKQTKRGRGRILIQFSSHEEFDRIRDLLTDAGGARLKLHTG